MEQAVSRRKKVKIIITPTYDDSRATIALWNDPQIIITPTYDDSRAKIALWNDPQIIITPTYDDSRAKIALWNDPLGYTSTYVHPVGTFKKKIGFSVH